ncbi:MAG: hypothetical protein V4587_08400 [Acidobacteriota bacterium]
MQRLQQLIDDAVSALTALDAYALEKIRLEMNGLPEAQLSAADIAAVEASNGLLGALLQETARNLRLFRASSVYGQRNSEAGCYVLPPF